MSIIIPPSVTKIDQGAFSGCTKCTLVIFEGQTEVHSDAFQNCPRLRMYGKYSKLRRRLIFENVECGISLEEFKDDSIVVILPCGHVFLQRPLHEWAKNQQICPTCRKEI
jgi:hypothetical protein